ncbi:MAG TPA: hypothetical protein DCR14_13815 [Acidimicrobiaceae bacterium]|nr:hypothetical protein [Acidimicrobiaceae bacterium]
MARPRPLLIAALLVLPITLAASPAMASPTTRTVTEQAQFAAGGMTVTNLTTYVVDPTAGVVKVLAEMQFTNTLPDQRDGNIITRRYFTGFSIPVPVGASNAFAATANGTPVRVTPRLVGGVENYYVLDVDFASNLFYQQTARINVSYDVNGVDPRGENPSRVNEAYAAFEAFGIGDPGRVTVKVVVPPGFESETFGDEAPTTNEFGFTVYTVTDIEEPDQFSLFVSARNDAALDSRTVTLDDGATFNVRAWPDDPEWEAFVVEQIEEGVPALAELIGVPWPIDGTVEVREAYTPFLYGYAGWFSASTREVEIDEELDAEVVLHELSHAWFNDNWFTERWLSEGFAQVYAAAVMEQLGGNPRSPTRPRTTDPGAIKLTAWTTPQFAEADPEEETFGYNTSYYLIQEMYDEVGPDAMREVLAAIADREIAYVGEGEPETVSSGGTWQRLLDLLENRGGSTEAQELIDTWVLIFSQSAQLDERAEARGKYADLVEAGDEWAAPIGLRRAMSEWRFDHAEELIAAATEVLAARDQLDEWAARLNLTYPDTFEADYQAATTVDDLQAIVEAIEEQIDAAETLSASIDSEAEDDGLLGGLGLMGTNLPVLLDEARTAWAEGDLDTTRARATEVNDTIADAPDVGRSRALAIGGAVIAVVLLVVVAILLLRRRKRRRAAAEQQATAEHEASAGSGELIVPLPDGTDDRGDDGSGGDDGGGGGDGGGD